MIYPVSCACRNKETSLKTWHVGTKIDSNGSSKISFVSLVTEKLFIFYIVLVLWFSGLSVKSSLMKNLKWIVFLESRYINSNSGVSVEQFTGYYPPICLSLLQLCHRVNQTRSICLYQQSHDTWPMLLCMPFYSNW